MKKLLVPKILICLILIFLYVPMLILVFNSFNASRYSSVWGGFSLIWYERLFADRQIWRAVQNTAIVALTSVAVSTALGTLAGVVLAQYKSRLQTAHTQLITLPLIVPDILMGMSFLLFFMSIRMPLSLTTIIIGHITFSISYVAATVKARFEDFDFSIVEAAYDLGANKKTVLLKIYLPLLSPGIFAGAMLALTLSLDDFIITFFTAGPGASTLPIQIYSMIRFGTPPVINALSTLFILLIFLIVLIYQRSTRRNYV